MNSTRDYSCELLSFIVLFVLSALSHFWFIMIAICIGIGLWGAGIVLSRIFLKIMEISLQLFEERSVRENAGLAVEMLNGVSHQRAPSTSAIAQIASQE